MASGAAHNPVTTIDEALLVARAKRDRESFAPLYIAYFERVHAYCYRRLGNPDDAADATSAVFARALASIATCRGDRFRSWLFAIAHNVLIDLYRARYGAGLLDDAMELQDQAPSPEDAAIAGERARTVTALLDQLSLEQRQVLELRLAGLTSREIGEVLGKHPNAVDQMQYRAVRRLRSLTGTAGSLLEGLR